MEALKFAKLEDRVEPRATQKENPLHLDALPGIWLNTDGDTGGIVKLVITSQGTKLKLRVFEVVGPDSRDWGEVEAEHIYSYNIASHIAAVFTPRDSLNYVVIHLQAKWNQCV